MIFVFAYLFFTINLSFLCFAKMLLIETSPLMPGKNESKGITGSISFDVDDDDKNVDAAANDYMADVKLKSVDVGKPVRLKCVSPQEFSACFFTKEDSLILYQVQPKAAFQ